MKKTRKHPSAEEKAVVLKRYLVDKVPMSDLCDEYGLQPSLCVQYALCHTFAFSLCAS